MDAEAHLQSGEELRDRWEVKKKLGKGGFGQIFIAFDRKLGEEVAIKTEARSKNPTGVQDPDAVEVLAMEQAVLKAVEGSPHFCKMIGCGQDPGYNFLVMTLCGPNLTDLRHESPRQYLSFGTAAQVTIHTVEALNALHNIGYLHRDIKPSNLAVGRGEASRIIYLVDFGLARPYVKWVEDEDGNKVGQIRKERTALGFRGTVRYASLTIHKKKDMGRVDDLWSVFYMFVEMAVGRLPWREETDKNNVRDIKERIGNSELISRMPSSLHGLLQHLEGLSYGDAPNYNYINDRFRNAMRGLKISPDEPFDWDASRTASARTSAPSSALRPTDWSSDHACSGCAYLYSACHH